MEKSPELEEDTSDNEVALAKEPRIYSLESILY